MDAGWTVFLIFTVLIAGGAAFLMGQAIAATWRPIWQCVSYGILLGFAERFMVFALFGVNYFLLLLILLTRLFWSQLLYFPFVILTYKRWCNNTHGNLKNRDHFF